ncbi:MAG: hypothetical protein SPLM_02940 [Spiroplasma phoeniceum]
MNFLADAVATIGFGDRMNSIWTGLGNVMGKVKDAVYAVLPQCIL